MTDLNPGNRPRHGIIAVGAAGAMVALVTVLVVAGPTAKAEASELKTFSSCGEVAAWGRASIDRQSEFRQSENVPSEGDSRVATDGAESGGAAPPSASPDQQSSGAEDAGGAGAGGTNVVVEGVDELDLVERLTDDRALMASGGRLTIVDLVAAKVVADLDVPTGAQVTYDPEAHVAWVVAPGEERDGVVVERVVVGDATLDSDAEWSTSGSLVDARRIGDRLHVVAKEGFAATEDDPSVPFEDGPVPCDQILHPVGPSDPSATLLVTLPVTGALEPEHAAEVVGAGDLVHVTTDAAYLATPLWEGEAVTTLHRFDLETLAHTGSGRVEGTLLNDFSMSDHDGHLRVAVTSAGNPIPDDQDRGASPPPVEEEVDADDPGISVAPERQDVRNEVVVLDTDGDLDVVGRTPRFGHPGEAIEGIRFVGDVAYAVTYLQTDPFYVIDLAVPAAPKVVGEVELPGFSAYLHPISETLVAGFGPDGDDRVAVKLFDVSDPAAPRVVDTLALGDNSEVVSDHHGFVDLGDGRFAVPATNTSEVFPEECTAEIRAEARAARERLQAEIEQLDTPGSSRDPKTKARANELRDQLTEIAKDGCLYPGPESAVVVVDSAGGRLAEVERHTARMDTGVRRVLPSTAGWALFGGGELVLLDPQGAERATLSVS